MSLVDAWRSIQQLCRSGEGSGSEGPSGNGMAHLSEEERRALRSQLYKQLAPQSWNDSVEYYCAVCNSAKEEGDAGKPESDPGRRKRRKPTESLA